METITSKWMNIIDANCEYLGIRKIQLMENAGSSVAQEMKGCLHKCKNDAGRAQNDKKHRIVMFAGTGNNGGDAFVAARHLAAQDGFSVSVILLGREIDIRTEEAWHNFMVMDRHAIDIFEVTDSSMLSSLSEMVNSADCIVDAMLGTGIRGRIREPISTAIDMINGSKAFTIAVDVPSGCDGDTGEYEKTVFADTTVTFHRMKPGIDGAKCAGTVNVVPIGIPDTAFRYVGGGDLLMLGSRNPANHKGDSGRVLIIGGGAYTGAPALAALAALRAGADIVTVAAPASVSREIQCMSPDIIVRTLSGERLSVDDIPILKPLIQEHDCVVIGMGLGKGCDDAVSKVVEMCTRVVVDADAITPAVIATLRSPRCDATAIITPHAGEFRRLAGLSEDIESRCAQICDFCKQDGSTPVITLLKGVTDIISDGTMTRLNSTGNAGMTVGGTGDVLAGVTGALFAVHDAFDAACLGAFINGRAGDIAYEQYGTGLIATDVIEKIPEAMRYD